MDKMLLIHWWHYYGKHIYTLEELEQFEQIIDQYGVDKVFEVVLASYICEDGSPTILLYSMRRNEVDKLFASLPNLENMTEKERDIHDKVKKALVKTISSTMKT